MRGIVAMRPILLILLALFTTTLLFAVERKDTSFADSIVRIEVTRQTFNNYRPWQRTEIATEDGVGTIIAGNHILTTAQIARGAILLKVKKKGREIEYLANVAYKNYLANIALLSVEEEAFWRDVKPASLDTRILHNGKIRTPEYQETIYREGDGEIIQHKPLWGTFEGVMYPTMTVEVKGRNLDIGSPVVTDNGVLGIITARSDAEAKVLPAALISSILDEVAQKREIGFSRLGVHFGKLSNPAAARSAGLSGATRGILVQRFAQFSPARGALQAGDVLLKIGEFPIDDTGNYEDPEYGYISFGGYLNLPRNRGKAIPMTILRNGKEQLVSIPFKSFDYDAEGIPLYIFEKQAYFAVRGGIVFQELSVDYLRLWDPWWKKAPSHLRHLLQENTAVGDTPIKRTVIISQVLPDDYTQGYEDVSNKVVTAINGHPINSINDVAEAFTHEGGFHTIALRSPENRLVVLDAEGFSQAHATILEKFGITQQENLR